MLRNKKSFIVLSVLLMGVSATHDSTLENMLTNLDSEQVTGLNVADKTTS